MLELTKAQRDTAAFVDLNNSYGPGGSRLLVINLQDVQKQIQNVLTTPKGSLVFEPNFGCNLEQYLQEPFDDATASTIEDEILSSLVEWCEVISINPAGIVVTLDANEPKFYIDLKFKVKSVGEVHSLTLTFTK